MEYWRNSREIDSVTIPATQSMKHRNTLRIFRLPAIALTGLIFALPLLGLNCEMACARGGAGAGAAGSPAQAEHCPAHDGTAPARSSGSPTPAVPDGCGHHGDTAALKKGIEGAEQGSRHSIVHAVLPASAVCAFDRFSVSIDSAASSITPRSPAALPRVLRL